MTFYYYDSEYLSSTSIMTATISGIELFLDGDANGKIDGHYNAETGYFILDENSDDQSLGFLDPDTDYNEYLFTPVPVMADGTVKYGQYFMKVRYTMNPRALIPADGVDTASARAQVLPAFVSTVTDPDNYEALTAEQQAYRYIISGLTKLSADGDEVRSSDGHPMYGAEATQPSIVDVPLGGDTSPAQLTEDGSAYTWDPDYQGNLLARFDDPEPIFIAESVAGPNIPIAEVTGYDETTREVELEEGGAAKLNGYLGSLTANNTVALCVQEQTATTDEIAKANGVTIGGGGVALQSEGAGEETPGINPESVTPADTKTTPDARYLQETGAAAEPDGQIDMSGSENEYSEFNQDFNVQLPSTDIGITDFASVIMDGDQVGFSIGLPLGGYSSNGDAGAGGPGGGSGGEWSGMGTALSESKESMQKLVNWMKHPTMANARATDDSYDAVQDAIHDNNNPSPNPNPRPQPQPHPQPQLLHQPQLPYLQHQLLYLQHQLLLFLLEWLLGLPWYLMFRYILQKRLLLYFVIQLHFYLFP